MVGTTIGKYRIVEKLGRGGMGTVYKAVDVTLDREVAVKVLNPDVSDATLMARFRAEATTLARLNHPQIATIFEIYQSETDLLMVMELVRGETLDHLSVRCGPLPPEHAAYLIAQVLGALSHAHRAGIVHRDLKPANVMVTDTGAVKIMDFGIARVLGAEHLTTDGMLMGTPAYMAPEQVLGHDVDARTDLYSAGVVLYRLLSGCLPFQAETPVAIIHKQVWEAPTPVRQHRADLPDWCETILARALEKAPEARFQSAEEFRSAIVSAVGQSQAPLGVRFDAYPPNPLSVANFPAPPGPLADTQAGQAGFPVPPPVPLDQAQTVGMVAGPFDPTVAAGDIARPSSSPGAPRRNPPPPVTPARSSPAATQVPGRTATTVAAGNAASNRTAYIAAAVAAAVVVVGVIVVPRLRTSGPPAATEVVAVETPAASEPGVPVESSPVPEASAPEPPAAAAPAVAPPPTTPTPRRAAPAAPPRSARPANVPPPAEKAPEPVNEPVPPPIPPAVSLPPVIFAAQMVVDEGGKSRQRDTIVRLSDGMVTVSGKDNEVVTTFPFAAIRGATYSRSKQPLQNSAQGPVEVAHVDGGAFGFLRGDQHWVVLTTDAAATPLVLHVREQDSNRIALAIEERTGRNVERLTDDKDR